MRTFFLFIYGQNFSDKTTYNHKMQIHSTKFYTNTITEIHES